MPRYGTCRAAGAASVIYLTALSTFAAIVALMPHLLSLKSRSFASLRMTTDTSRSIASLRMTPKFVILSAAKDLLLPRLPSVAQRTPNVSVAHLDS